MKSGLNSTLAIAKRRGSMVCRQASGDDKLMLH